jgi:hypothetical protein
MTTGKMHPATARPARRRAELRELDALMREPGGLAALPPPRPLHKMAAARSPRTSPHTRGGAAPKE